MATTQVYTSTDIVRENVYVVQPPAVSPLYKGIAVTQGGTKTDAGTVTGSIATLADLTDILADSIPISALAHKFLKPSALVGVQKAVSALTSQNHAITGMAWATGVVTCISAAHGLPVGKDIYMTITGCTPDGYNGVQLCTIADAGTFTFPSADYGTVTIEGDAGVVHGTATAHGMTDGDIAQGFINGVTPSALAGEYPITYVSTADFYYPHVYDATTVTLVNAKITMAQATFTAHGLPLNTLFPVSITGTSPTDYNGLVIIAALDIDTIYWAVNTTNLTPVAANTRLSVALLTATAHGFELGKVSTATISGASPLTYDGAKNATALTANILSFVPTQNSAIGTATVLGKLLNANASELYAVASSFFAQGQQLVLSVLELGADTVENGVTALSNFLAQDSKRFHAYALPTGWDTDSVKTLAQTYDPLKEFPLFIVTTDLAGSAKFKGLYDVVCVINSNSIKKGGAESLAGGFMYDYLSRYPAIGAPMGQNQYEFINSMTPYEFASSNDSLIRDFLQANLTYVADCAEGGISKNMLMGAYLMASDSDLGQIDASAKWSVNYIVVEGDKVMAALVINSANDPAKRLNLNDSDGIHTVNAIRAAFQGFLNDAAAKGIIESQSTIDGVLTPVTATAVPYFAWKAANPLSYAQKHYDGLSAIISTRKGITNLTISIGVQFV